MKMKLVMNKDGIEYFACEQILSLPELGISGMPSSSVAKIGKDIIGHLSIGTCDYTLDKFEIMCVKKVEVDEAYRNKGVAKNLYISTIKHLEEQGDVDILFSKSDDIFSRFVIQIYRSLGFENIYLQDGDEDVEGYGYWIKRKMKLVNI
jgi:GNAT superfamily N-acetyltransferase